MFLGDHVQSLQSDQNLWMARVHSINMDVTPQIFMGSVTLALRILFQDFVFVED